MSRQSFLKGSAVLMSAMLVTKLLGMIYKIPLTSMLGGSGMSCYSGAFAVFTPVFAAAASGATGAVSRLVSEQLALGRYKNAVRIHRTALVIFSLTSLSLAALLIFSAEYLAENVIHITQAKWAVICVSLSLFPAAVMNVQRGWAEGLGSMTPTASSEIVETVFKLVCGLALPQYVLKYAERSFAETHGCFGIYFADKNELLSACKPFMAAAAILGVSAASFAACVFIFVRTGLLSRTRRRETANRFDSPPPDISRKSAVAKLMKFALPSSLIAVISTLSGMADLVTITPQLKKAMAVSPQLFEYLGAYGISESERAAFVYGSYTGLALTVYGLLPTFTAMLGKSALPSLTTAYACKNWEESGRCVSSMLLISAIISMSGGLGICVLAKPLLVLFFGSSAAEISVADTPLSILAIAVIFTGIALPCLSVLQACSRQFLAAAITLVGAAIKLFLNFTLIKLPLFGINGAAVSTAVSQAVMCVWAVAALIRCSGSGKTAVRSVFIPLIPAILCAAAAYLAQKCVVMRFDGVIGRVGVLFSIAFGSIICLISLALLCISPKNRIKNLFFKKNTKTS